MASPDTRPDRTRARRWWAWSAMWDENEWACRSSRPCKNRQIRSLWDAEKIRVSNPDQRVNGAYFAHARPVYVGRPTP